MRGSRLHPARLTLAIAAVLVGDPRAALRRRRAGVAARGPSTSTRRSRCIAAACCLWRAVAHPKERKPWLVIGLGMVSFAAADLYYTIVAPAAGRRHPLPVARRRALPRPLPVLLRRAAAARPLPRRAAAVDAVGRRPDRRARLRRRRLRARLRPGARRHRRRPADGRHQPRLPDRATSCCSAWSPACSASSGSAAGAPGRRSSAASRCSGSRTRSTSGASPTAPTRSAACSTPRGPPAWSSSAPRRGSARAGSTRGPWPTAASSPSR